VASVGRTARGVHPVGVAGRLQRERVFAERGYGRGVGNTEGGFGEHS